MSKIQISVVVLGVMCGLLISSCNLANTGASSTSTTSSAGTIKLLLPDLLKEMPTNANQAARQTNRTLTSVGPTALDAYFAGRPNQPGMEWHSAVMLTSVFNLGSAISSQLSSTSQKLPEAGASATVTLGSMDLMNVHYGAGLSVTISGVASPVLHYIVQGSIPTSTASNGGTVVFRYAAVPNADGDVQKGYFVWANATEYTSAYNSSTHVKEYVAVRFDISDKAAKKLLVDTVHYHNGMNYYYGFSLKSIYNETTKLGKGQYVDATQGMNCAVVYTLGGSSVVAALSDDGTAINDQLSFDANNNSTGNHSAGFVLSDLGFTALGVSAAPKPYFNTSNSVQAGSTIAALLADWAGKVNYAAVAFP